jgi:hypothetical protein
MSDYEKLGVFYLGKEYDPANQKRLDDLVLYDSKDLVTHAVCVGMTGSGKTGLCIDILEEAAMDGIPAIVIDPKGDLSNLLLLFPQLRPEDFRPWINEDDAARMGLTADQFAQGQAELWTKGLAEWQQNGARIQRLKDAADFVIYTPGSSAGLPISILTSFAAPDKSILEDGELLRERIATTATSLLVLIGIDADPIKSREHILLSTIINFAWFSGADLDLGSIIQQIQHPPVTRIGVMDLEGFFPATDRFTLAMQINNLLAAPGFSAWMEGEPLDIGSILHTPQGKPRVAVFSIAHLGDAERMFFVSLLMNQVLGWVRMQSGTTSLRAIVYMDEIAGYFPPVANPPSKQPMLTLMKQARAFGVGMVLATQNPVDIDYKGLANAGTWFLGRLQTERDKARVLDGLEGSAAAASAKFDRGAVDKMLSGLGNRIFLMNNVHDDTPRIIESRWALSYLRGPMTRNQIKMLTDAKKSVSTATDNNSASGAAARESSSAAVPTTTDPAPPSAAAPQSRRAAAPEVVTRSSNGSQRPVLPPDIPQYFLPLRGAPPAGTTVLYKPMVLGSAKVYFNDPKSGVDLDQQVSYLAAVGSGPVAVDWDSAAAIGTTESDLEKDCSPGATFDPLPSGAGKGKSYEDWKKSFADMLYRMSRLELLKSDRLEQISRPGESERDFRVRLVQAAREERDRIAEKLRQKYAPRVAAMQERLRRAEQAVEVQAAQAREAKLSTAMSFGSAVLGAFLGKKTFSATNVNKAASAVRGVGRSAKESGDVTRANETVEAVKQTMAELEAQFQAEVSAAAARVDPATERFEEISVKPKKTSIAVRAVVLAWAPHWQDASGKLTDGW